MLVAERVEAVYLDCLYIFGDNSRLFWTVIGSDGMHVALNPARVGSHLGEIESFLSQFPSEFHQENGSGTKIEKPFCDRFGNQWTESIDIVNMLLVLGIAIGRVELRTRRVSNIGFDVFALIK